MNVAVVPKQVAEVYDGYPEQVRSVLLSVRNRVFYCAKSASVGPLSETLKWGQPSYLTDTSKAGTTIRLAMSGTKPAVFLNCNTTLVDGYRSDFPTAFAYLGNRALILPDSFDETVLDICLTRALTYHRTRRERRVS